MQDPINCSQAKHSVAQKYHNPLFGTPVDLTSDKLPSQQRNRPSPKQSGTETRSTIVSISGEKSRLFLRKPRLNIDDEVPIAKKGLPFKKGYEQCFTYAFFVISKKGFFKLFTHNLTDSKNDIIQAKFYQCVSVNFNGLVGQLCGNQGLDADS